MFALRETATILAALQFWREEMCSHSVEVMRPYFDAVGMAHIEPLTADEIDGLMARLRGDPRQE